MARVTHKCHKHWSPPNNDDTTVLEQEAWGSMQSWHNHLQTASGLSCKPMSTSTTVIAAEVHMTMKLYKTNLNVIQRFLRHFTLPTVWGHALLEWSGPFFEYLKHWKVLVEYHLPVSPVIKKYLLESMHAKFYIIIVYIKTIFMKS